MQTRTLLTLGLLALAAAATYTAWRQHLEVVRLEARLGEGSDSLEGRLAAANRHARELEAELAALRGASPLTVDEAKAAAARQAQETAAAATLAAQLTPADGAESRREAELDLLAAVADSPEFQSLIALQQRGAIDGKYAALFRKLHLTPEQQTQFERLLADRQSAYADAMIAARNQGLSGKDARTLALQVARSTQKEIDGSIQTLLGPAGYGQYQNYERTLPQRETVNQLAQRLDSTATPLTASQQEHLVQTLAQGARQQKQQLAAAAAASGQKPAPVPTTLKSLPGPLAGLGLSSASGAVITPIAVSNAQSFLTPAQVAALQLMQQEQQAQQSLAKLIRSAAPKPAPKPKAGG